VGQAPVAITKAVNQWTRLGKSRSSVRSSPSCSTNQLGLQRAQTNRQGTRHREKADVGKPRGSKGWSIYRMAPMHATVVRCRKAGRDRRMCPMDWRRRSRRRNLTFLQTKIDSKP
jgi:hypothetical protein